MGDVLGSMSLMVMAMMWVSSSDANLGSMPMWARELGVARASEKPVPERRTASVNRLSADAEIGWAMRWRRRCSQRRDGAPVRKEKRAAVNLI